MGGKEAKCSTSSEVAVLRSSGTTTWLTGPTFKASSAVTVLQVRKSSIALESPIQRVKKTAPPSPGTSPTFAKVSAKLAALEAILKSHMAAKSHPAPTAAPLTIAIKGVL